MQYLLRNFTTVELYRPKIASQYVSIVFIRWISLNQFSLFKSIFKNKLVAMGLKLSEN